LAAGVVLLAGCFLASTRPAFAPFPEAPAIEVELTVPEATRRLAEALRADSIPVSRVEVRDGWLETPWFDAATGAPVGHVPVGLEIVRVRGWIDVGRPEHSNLTVETVYHRVVDPSRPERLLDRIAAPDNPAVVRVKGTLDSLEHRYGTPAPPPPATPAPQTPVPPRPDSLRRDSLRVAPAVPQRTDTTSPPKNRQLRSRMP
jgi:hypothetical protein